MSADLLAAGVAGLLALAFTWGGSFLFIKYILEGTGPIEVALGRVVLGVVAIGAYMLVAHKRLQASPTLVGRVSFMAVANNVLPFILIPWGEEHISAKRSSTTTACAGMILASLAPSSKAF